MEIVDQDGGDNNSCRAQCIRENMEKNPMHILIAVMVVVMMSCMGVTHMSMIATVPIAVIMLMLMRM